MIHKHRSSGGFTLIELLVVLAILVATYTLIPPLFSKGASTAELKSSARQIASALRATRAEAIAKNSARVFLLNLKERHFSVAERPSQPLAKSIDLKLRTAESERIDQDIGGIRFFPDGSSTGGGITLSNKKQKIEIGVEWLTGRVEIDGTH
ncbi:MAG: GspH/FimT family pseudopilin [Candidatus Polarisedimenticolaceae bacterium]|nr:GspH/FimT family pseudopilin [Candidatus Polarisedimenticolaceae bacterium]